MLQIPDETTGAGHAGTAADVQPGEGEGVMGGAVPRERPVHAGGDGPGQQEGSENTGDEDQGEGDRDGGDSDEEESEAGAADAGPEVHGSRRAVSDYDLGRALKAACGDFQVAAMALGVNKVGLYNRVNRTPALKALYGGNLPRNTNGELHEIDSMRRTPDDLPEVIDGTELAAVVGASDNAILMGKLKEMGLSEKTLQKLKTLDEMATDTGKFLSISLEKTHRIYFAQVMALFESANTFRDTYLDPEFQCSNEERAFFYKTYVEMVREFGRAYNMMMQGAQAMVKMISSSKASMNPNGVKAKPGWARRQLNK